MSWWKKNSGGSEAREKAEMYAKAEKDLSEKISELKGHFETAETYKREKYNTFLNGAGSAEGLILDDFESAVIRWGNKFDNLMMYMRSMLVVVESRRAQARQLKEYYEAMAAAEEMAING